MVCYFFPMGDGDAQFKTTMKSMVVQNLSPSMPEQVNRYWENNLFTQSTHQAASSLLSSVLYYEKKNLVSIIIP